MHMPTHSASNAGLAVASVVRAWPNLQINRNVVIALAVVALHVGLLWLFQSGLLMRATELLVPVQVLARQPRAWAAAAWAGRWVRLAQGKAARVLQRLAATVRFGVLLQRAAGQVC